MEDRGRAGIIDPEPIARIPAQAAGRVRHNPMSGLVREVRVRHRDRQVLPHLLAMI